jgi:hypothetical protein
VRTCCASRVSVRCVGASSINFAARVRVWSLTREASVLKLLAALRSTSGAQSVKPSTVVPVPGADPY